MQRGSAFRGPVGLTPAENKIAAGVALIVLLGAGYAALERSSRPVPHVEFEIHTLSAVADADAHGSSVTAATDAGRRGAPPAAWIRGRLDLNSADYADLLRLPGIGPVLATRIIEYRDRHGPFAAVDSLINVSGIGPVKLDKLREAVYIRETDE